MFIRSQNKTALINMDRITAISIAKQDNKYHVCVANVPRAGIEDLLGIGQYSTEEKALKVLDKIENTYVRFQQRYGSSTKHRDCIYVMPQEDEI